MKTLLTILFALAACPVFAAVTPLNATGDEDSVFNCNDCSITASWGGGSCPNGYVVVTVSAFDPEGDTITSATYNGNAMTEHAKNIRNGSSSYWVSQFGYKLGAGGDTTDRTVALDTSASLNFVLFHSNMYCGVDQTTPTRTIYTNNGIATTATVTVVDSASGDLVVDGLTSHPGTNPIAVGASQTERTNHYEASKFTAGTSDEPATGASTVMSWSLTGAVNYYAIIATALVPSVSTRRAVAPVVLQ